MKVYKNIIRACQNISNSRLYPRDFARLEVTVVYAIESYI